MRAVCYQAQSQPLFLTKGKDFLTARGQVQMPLLVRIGFLDGIGPFAGNLNPSVRKCCLHPIGMHVPHGQNTLDRILKDLIRPVAKS